MSELINFISSIDANLIKVLGMAISAVAGLVVFIMSSRSANYKRIDRSMLLSSILYFLYLHIVVTSAVGIAIGIGLALFGIDPSYTPKENHLLISLITGTIYAALIIVIFWGFVIRTKRMKAMMAKAKEESRWMYLLINWISVVIILLIIPSMPFNLFFEITPFATGLMVFSYGLLFWWLAIIVAFIWKTAKYVYSEMKITLLDGEVITYSCSPEMCRIHKHYIRLLKRDEKKKIIYERHINEDSVKQIEYM